MAETSGTAENVDLVDEPSTPAVADGVTGYGVALRTLKAWAGNPSLQVLARRSAVPRSTLADALNPARRSLPRFDVVTALIVACGLPDESVKRWQRAWREIQRRQTEQPARTPNAEATAGAGPVGRTFLPGDIADFTGRAAETAAVLDALRASAQPVMTIAAIDGMAGVGKTTLAVHAAHLLAADNPDGQFFVDLHGHTPGRDPLEPAVALQRLLAQLGVDSNQLPREVGERAALWRAETAGRRALVLLDNAASVEQVRPLLPGGACPVLITSRRRLVGLEGTNILSTRVMPDDDARMLFERVAGADRVAGQREAVAEAVALCGFLPLAIRIAAARLRHRPVWSTSDLVTRLRDEQRRLAELSGTDRAVAAAFTMSVQQLAEPVRTMFRLLGLHPGPDIDVPAAASLAGCPSDEAERLLEELLDAHLVEQHTIGRYTFHDLLRAYAAQLVASEETDAVRVPATRRMVEHYLHCAHGAGLLSYATHPVWPQLDLPDPSTDLTPIAFASRERALCWYGAEHVILVGVIRRAAGAGLDRLAWQLAGVLGGYLLQAGLWREWLAVNTIALAAGERGGDKRGQAHAHHWLGQLHRSEGHHPTAHEHLTQALALFEALELPALAGQVLLDIALTYGEQAAFADAIEYSHAGLDLCRSIGDRLGEGRALNSVGFYMCQQGRYIEALSYCEQALELSREVNPHVEAGALTSLGMINYRLANYPEALRYYEDSLRARRTKGDYFLQADVMTRLGETYRAMGHLDTARDLWRQALVILEGLQHRDAAGVRARLAEPSLAEPN